MHKLAFSYYPASGDANKIEDDFQQAQSLTDIVQQEAKKQYDTDYSFINVVEDTAYHEAIAELADEKRMHEPAALVVIGIGGSNLGTIAIQEAIYGQFFNRLYHPIDVYFADTVDARHTRDIYQIVREYLVIDKPVLLAIVTKSGTTTETLTNATLFIDLLKTFRPNDYTDQIVAITDHGSPLWEYAQSIGTSVLEIPQRLGGRFSVLSAVGLFPLAVLGVDIRALCKGARVANSLYQESNDENDALRSAVLLHNAYKNGRNIHDTFVFDASFYSLGLWYRQLMGESLGKQETIDGKKMHIGMTPTVSVGSVDLHSVTQLYLAGPQDKITTFVTTQEHDEQLIIPDDVLSQRVHTAGKSAAAVQEAIFGGVLGAYERTDRPYMMNRLLKSDPKSIGQFIQFKFYEIVYLAHLLKVNPFNQPQVELYKQETRRILTGE